MNVLLYPVILWILAMSYTVWKRDRQLKKIENKLNKFFHEQEERQREAEKAKQAPNNTG